MARILILEDDEWVASRLASELTLAGHIALDAHSGREAVRLAESMKPELLITNLAMPGGEGLETISRIRRLDPEVKAISYACEPLDARRRSVAAACGADRVLDWNFDANGLVESVNEILATAR